MRAKTARMRWASALGLVALLVAACGSSDDADSGAPESTGGAAASTTEAAGEPVRGGDLRVVHTANPSSLDPIGGGSGGDHVSLYPLFDRLVNFEPETLEPLPGLATSWDFPDPQTLVLQIQPGVTFHDGTPLDVEAVRFNLERARSGEGSRVKAEQTSVDSIEATGPLEVTLHLNRPDSALILIFADRTGMMVSPTAVAASGKDFSLNPVGSGPFKFLRWLPGDRLELTRYDGYWQEGKPYVDPLTMRYLTDAQTGNNALLADEADFKTGVQASDVDSLKANANLEVSLAPSLYTWMCYFNTAKAPFNDVAARQAFNRALDRESLDMGMLFGEGEPAWEIFPPGYWAYQPDSADAWPHDPTEAKDLLAGAGMAGAKVRGLILDAPGYARMGEIVQAQVKEAGFDMTLETMEVGAGSKAFFEEGAHDTLCAAWTGRPDPILAMSQVFSSKGYYTAGKTEPAGFEQLIAAASVSPDTAERAEAFAPMIAIIDEEARFAPLVHAPSINAMQANVKGFAPNLYGKPDVSFLWLEE